MFTTRSPILSAVVAWAVVSAGPSLSAGQSQSATPAQPPAKPAASAPALTDLDAFMAKVLEKRNENWRTLHDYILSEREVFEVTGPLGIPIHGLHRDFQWFIRDGYLVRSPVSANGVAISADERQKYEERWLAHEKEREKKEQEKGAVAADERREVTLSMSVSGDVQFTGLAGSNTEPRFISEAYFMRFRFEPGNYYFAGREKLDGRDVLKVEYLPSNLFNDHDDEKKANRGQAPKGSDAGKPAAGGDKHAPAAHGATAAPARVEADSKKGKGSGKRDNAGEDDDDERIDRAMNKTSTVTMWIDPEEYQIVRFVFENPDWGFLPGRQIVRLDGAQASMTMGREFEHIWLPKDITFSGAATVAAGTLRFRYARQFSDYRRGEVSAKIRGYVPKEPQS